MPAGRIWGLDAATGKMLWTFFILPEGVSDYGYDTWWNGMKTKNRINFF
jgi:hypothetical protein